MTEERSVGATGIEVAERLASEPALRERLISTAQNRFRIGREDAEDLLQEATLVLARSPQVVLQPDGFAYIVFQRCCFRYVERESRRRGLLARAVVPGSESLRDEATATELSVALRQGLERLSSFCRQLLRGHYVDGLSYAESARAFSRSERGISTLVSRCLARLRKVMT